jgi:hypothetical protein
MKQKWEYTDFADLATPFRGDSGSHTHGGESTWLAAEDSGTAIDIGAIRGR